MGPFAAWAHILANKTLCQIDGFAVREYIIFIAVSLAACAANEK